MIMKPKELRDLTVDKLRENSLDIVMLFVRKY